MAAPRPSAGGSAGARSPTPTLTACTSACPSQPLGSYVAPPGCNGSFAAGPEQSFSYAAPHPMSSMSSFVAGPQQSPSFVALPQSAYASPAAAVARFASPMRGPSAGPRLSGQSHRGLGLAAQPPQQPPQQPPLDFRGASPQRGRPTPRAVTQDLRGTGAPVQVPAPGCFPRQPSPMLGRPASVGPCGAVRRQVGSYVPPPVPLPPSSGSFVAPPAMPTAQSGPAHVSQGSYVAPPMPLLMQSGPGSMQGSYVAPPPMAMPVHSGPLRSQQGSHVAVAQPVPQPQSGPGPLPQGSYIPPPLTMVAAALPTQSLLPQQAPAALQSSPDIRSGRAPTPVPATLRSRSFTPDPGAPQATVRQPTASCGALFVPPTAQGLSYVPAPPPPVAHACGSFGAIAAVACASPGALAETRGPPQQAQPQPPPWASARQATARASGPPGWASVPAPSFSPLPVAGPPGARPCGQERAHSSRPAFHHGGGEAEDKENAARNPEKYSKECEVQIGPYRVKCQGVLGKGSFSEVWSGSVVSGPERLEVALKDISCSNPADMQQAVLEQSLLERFRGLASQGPGEAAPVMRIPRYLAHTVEKRREGTRMRLAMARVPGEPLDAFLRRPPPPKQDGPSAVRRGSLLALQLLRQLGPTLERIGAHAFHRDVNSHNILLSDAVDGGRLRMDVDEEEVGRRASFWLIDFGLAVDTKTWPQQWPTADVAGDCRYWPPSSFLMSFYGPEETAQHKDFCEQYKSRLDVAGLGLTALEVMCATALSSSYTWGEGELRGSWRRLLSAWEKYREEVTRWHTMIFQVFTAGGDITPLYQQLGQERIVDKVAAHIAKLRSLLRACTQRTEDLRVKSLLHVLAEMIDEKSPMGLREAVAAVGGPMGQDCPMPAPQPATQAVPMPHAPAAIAMQPLGVASVPTPMLSWVAAPPATPANGGPAPTAPVPALGVAMAATPHALFRTTSNPPMAIVAVAANTERVADAAASGAAKKMPDAPRPLQIARPRLAGA